MNIFAPMVRREQSWKAGALGPGWRTLAWPSVCGALLLCGTGVWAGFSSVANAAPAKGGAPVELTADASAAARCAALAGKKLGGATINSAEVVEAGKPVGTVDPLMAKLLSLHGPAPASAPFCRVRATAVPEAKSRIKMEMWLPLDWNGRMVGVGGGGLNGGLSSAWVGFNQIIKRGYAPIATDAGHNVTEEASWALHSPSRIEDFAHRANHVAARFGKSLIADYYGHGPRFSYFDGCSNGGRDALMLAQRHPEDYDGIAAGAPANNWTGLLSTGLRDYKLIQGLPDPAGFQRKLGLLHDAALRKCDAVDGVADGVIGNPSSCRFDPAELSCKPGAAPGTCLEHAEVAVVRRIYAASKTRDGRRVIAGWAIGSEAGKTLTEGWGFWLTSDKAGLPQIATQYLKYLVHQDPSWTPAKFDFDRDLALARQRTGKLLDATSPDISAFVRRRGKLLLYHGSADAAIPAGSTIDYYKALRSRLADPDRTVRFFLAPGMAHCFAGAGPSSFDKLGVLDQWVSQGKAPERIIATKYDNDFLALAGMATKATQTRPLCPWPKVARYRGMGSTDDASNFTCAAPGA